MSVNTALSKNGNDNTKLTMLFILYCLTCSNHMNKLPINHSFTGFNGFKYSLASTVVAQAGNKRAVYDKRGKVLLKEKISKLLPISR